MADNTMSLSQKIADFIAQAEFDQHSSSLKTSSFAHSVQETAEVIGNKLKNMEEKIDHFKSLMTQTGIAQWWDNTQKLLNHNKQEITALTSFYQEVHTHIVARCERLNHSTMNAIKHASQFFVSTKNNVLQKMAETKSQELKRNHVENLSQLKSILHSLRFKNLLTVLCLSVIAPLIVSLYINNALPWQAHEKVIEEREAGKALLTSWQHLSPADQNKITHYA